LDILRKEIRDVTENIINQVHHRMELSKQIGELKNKMSIDINDEKAERDIRGSVLRLSKKVKMDTDFSARLLNILLMESVRLQEDQQSDAKHEQTHLAVFMKAKELEAMGKKIIHLEVGEPDFKPPKRVKHAIIRAYNHSLYHYTETRGIKRLRDAIAKKARNNITGEEVIVTPGARFALFIAFQSLLKPGDEVIGIEPAWPAYKDCANLMGAKINFLKTTLEDRWLPNTRNLRKMINPSTKMIVINYPNNPTGKLLDIRTQEQIVSIAKENGIYLLSDEVYSDYTFGGFRSILESNYDKSVMISSFSKTYAMTGFRVGFAIARNEIISKLAKVQACALTSVAEPMQYSALAALRADSASKNRLIIQKRLNLISERLKDMSLSFFEPEGGMYVYPRLNNNTNDTAIVEKLLDVGVAVAPGSGFGSSYKRFIRISACQGENVLKKGLAAFEHAMDTG
jgi:aspartate aminotransferase